MRDRRSAPCSSSKHLVRGLREQLFERAQHQRQRRAELVADVGEERRLRAIDLGQRLGAPASRPRRPAALARLAAISPAARVEKAPVGVVELSKRIQTGNEDALTSGFAARRIGRSAPLAAELCPKRRLESCRRIALPNPSRTRTVWSAITSASGHGVGFVYRNCFGKS